MKRMKVVVVMEETIATAAKSDLRDLLPAVLPGWLVEMVICGWKSMRCLIVVVAKYVKKIIPIAPQIQNGVLQPQACDSMPLESVAIARPKSPVAP